MKRRNYFDMLGLDFDPPEKNEKKIQKAIELWKKRTEDSLANETDSMRRSALSAELDLYENIIEIFKESKLRNTEARELKDLKISQLENLIDIMLVGQTGTPEVTNAQIRNVHLKLKLSPNTIETIYTNKGFSIQKRNQTIKLNDIFLTTVTAENIRNNMNQLRSMTMPKYPWNTKTSNLYELACYFSGGIDADVSTFYRKKTSELNSHMEVGASQFASDMSKEGRILANLFTAGTTQVFDSEISRKKYEQSLEREKLKDFFMLLKAAPDDFKKDRFFAESCIKTIQKSFSDYNVALTLYNHESGITQDPYEPIEALIHVTCATCKTPSEFRSIEDAQMGKCAICGSSIYTECPKCKKKVPAISDWCSCGFRVSEMLFFEEYYNDAEFALKEMNLPEARKQLTNAENAYPNHPKLTLLKKLVQDETEKYQTPLNEIKSLIEMNKFYAAKKKLDSIVAIMPQLKLDEQRKIIVEKLMYAQKQMPADSMPSTARANKCVEILEIIQDYQPAIDMLEMCKPISPSHLHGSMSSVNPLTCTLTWNSTSEKGVAYCVTRKKDGIPERYTDGDILINNFSALEFKDKNVQPGIRYGYAVFALRQGVYSAPATCEVEQFSELDVSKLKTIADSNVCRFSWVLPTNCIGVRILRSTNAIPSITPSSTDVILSERSSADYDDTSVANNTAYGYRLQCIYPYGNNFKYSDGHTIMLTPEQPPISLRNITSKIDGRLASIAWDAPDDVQRSVVIREIHPNFENLIGQIINASDINSIIGNGKTYSNTTSSAQQCQFEIPPNATVTLAIVVIAGSKGIVSEIIKLSSVEKCEINKLETRIEGLRLKIILQNTPKNLYRIHYIVAKKVDNKIPWATIEDAKRNNLLPITLADYNKDGMILVESLPKTDLYISVIGEHKMPDGNIVYSEPSKLKVSNKPKQKITYNLTWGSTLFSSKPKAKDCKLNITALTDETPELKLVYRSDGHIPMKLSDPKTVVLHIVPETESGFTSGKYTYTFPDSTWDSLKPQTELRLMLIEDDMSEYEVIPENIVSLKVPQK